MMAANSAGVVIVGSMPSLAKLARTSAVRSPSLIAALSVLDHGRRRAHRRDDPEHRVVGGIQIAGLDQRADLRQFAASAPPRSTAIARILPVCTCGSSTDLPLIVSWIWPPITSAMIGPEPR